MLEETYAKSGARPDVEGLRRLALLHDIGKELLNWSRNGTHPRGEGCRISIGGADVEPTETFNTDEGWSRDVSDDVVIRTERRVVKWADR
jgi:hypothetical protein